MHDHDHDYYIHQFNYYYYHYISITFIMMVIIIIIVSITTPPYRVYPRLAESYSHRLIMTQQWSVSLFLSNCISILFDSVC